MASGPPADRLGVREVFTEPSSVVYSIWGLELELLGSFSPSRPRETEREGELSAVLLWIQNRVPVGFLGRKEKARWRGRDGGRRGLAVHVEERELHSSATPGCPRPPVGCPSLWARASGGTLAAELAGAAPLAQAPDRLSGDPGSRYGWAL